MDAVWEQYINDNNGPPSNAFKLVNYSRHHNELRTLSYKEAKKVMDKHTTTLKNPSNDIQRANSLMINGQYTRQRARSHNDHDNKDSDDDPPIPSRDYKRRRSHHHQRNGSKFDKHRQIKRHPRRHSNDLNDRKYRKMKQTKKNIISFKQPKSKKSANQSSSGSSSSNSSSNSSDSSDDDRKRFEKMTKKKSTKRRKSERVKRTNSAKNIFGLIKSKKASTPTPINNNFRPGSAKNIHIEELQKKSRSFDDEDENAKFTHSKSLRIQKSSTSPARSKWKPKKLKSANILQTKSRKRKKPRLKRPKLPSNSYYCGDHVMLSQQREGIILYIGEVHFAKGTWVGLELVNGAVGAHDGVVEKKRYFQTAPNRGIFVKECHIKNKVDTTPNVSKRSYSMDLNDPNFAKEEKAKLGLMHPLEPTRSYSIGSDNSSIAASNHSAHSAQSHNHLDIVMDDREDSRPLSTKSMNAASDNYDIMEFKEMVRAEVESEFKAKFDEFKKMMIKESKHGKHGGHRRKKKKHRKDKKKRRRAKSKRRKDKKQLSKLKKMEKRRKDRSKSRGIKLKSSEDEIKSNEHVKSVSLNIEIQDFEHEEVEQEITAESEEYRKNSDLNVNEEEFAFESEDDDEDQDDVNNMDPIGLSLNVKSSNANDDGDEVRSPSNMMSDFDEKDIGYTNQLVQGTNNGKGSGLGSNFKFKLW